jgi:DNA-binding MarR family transcriptional regulator
MPASHSSKTKNTNSAEPKIAEIMSLLSKVSRKFAPENLGMKQWMVENFNNPKIAEILQDSTILMLRVLDAIGRLEPVNGITISKEFHIPKGSVSKTTRRLIAKKLIKAEARPNNKKEILYRTTPLGREIFQAHQAFDKQIEKGFIQFLERFDSDELQFIVRGLQDFLNVSFLNEEVKSKS